MCAALTPSLTDAHTTRRRGIVKDNILPSFQVISLSKRDDLEALNTMASGGWSDANLRLPATALRGKIRFERLHVQSPEFQGTSVGSSLRRRSISPRSIDLKPATPNCSTVKDPNTVPYSMAL